MTPRSVLYVTDGFPKLTHTFVATEMAEVVRRGVAVRVLSLRPGDTHVVHDVVRANGLVGLTTYDRDRFDDVVEELAPDVIHAHFATKATAFARDLSARTGVPYTFTAHRYDIWNKAPDDLQGRAMDAAAVVTVSEANVRRLGEFGVPAEHIAVIPCGVDVDEFRPASHPAGRPLVVAVARLHPVKNLPVLVEAAAILRDQDRDFEIAVIGEGDERGSLEALIVERTLTDVVRLIGAATQSQVREWWQRADLGVLSSDMEGRPVSLMEAAACGVPVVVTDVGGNAELVDDGVTGLVVPPRDPAALARGLGRLLDDPSERARMSHAARERAVAELSVQRQVDQLMGVWSAVLDGVEAVR